MKLLALILVLAIMSCSSLTVYKVTPEERMEFRKGAKMRFEGMDVENPGFLVSSLQPGSYLEKMGVQEGDVISKVNDLPVKDLKNYGKISNILLNSESVKLTILRNSKAIEENLFIKFKVTKSTRSDEKMPVEEVATKLPESLEEAVDQIVSGLSENDRNTVKNTQHDDLILFHHGWGTGIRNSLGLWRGNKELLKSACGSVDCHPDDASMEIIYGVWNKLNGYEYRSKPSGR